MKTNNQRGFGVIGIIIAVVVVAALALGGWYVYQQRSGGGGASILGIGGPSDKCEFNDKTLCKFVNSFKAQQDFTITSTSGSGDQKSDSTFAMSGQDSHSVISVGGKEFSNVIVLGDTTYTKDYSDNKWWKETAKKDAASKDDQSFNPDKGNADPKTAEPPKPTYKPLGKEACGKLQCYKYQVITPGTDGSEYIWFDDSRYLLRKTQDVAADGSTSTAEYSYDKVTIKAPSPVKEGSPSATDASGGLTPAQQAELDKLMNSANSSDASTPASDSSQ